ncbi:DHA2 family efflux MFS transporter permease subunit [Streptomyces sp. NBC_00094]|uniref:DHA2 family efflux MFS transporter permease subunit n=1 Tax=Streptomyces sp. NBC_00094 TaxID=2903620 RepID=UPI00225AEC1C|nr:DHA2 family efflux MFS transporter permease subunit [Streptomyces sp. NBC_00094]MCX5394398.1 DHA2 family efflux MFS transporter permease subunit [Streptomyces sp. NBC_00094]
MTTASPQSPSEGTATLDTGSGQQTPDGSVAASATARLALLVASGATFLAVLDTTVVNIAFSDLRTDFPAASLSELTWVVTAYTVVFAALLAVAGRVADVVGRRRLFLWSTVLFTIASVLSGLAPGVGVLVAARALQGVAAAGMIPSALGLVLQHTPAARRSAAVGVWGAVGSMAAAVGPSLGGLLVDVWGWRSVFLINLPIGLAVALIAARGLAGDTPSGRKMPDPVGTLALALGVGGLVFGVTQGTDWGWGSRRVLALLIGGAVLAAAALLRSRRHAAPAIEWDLWRSRTFAASNIASLLFGAAMYAYLLSTLLYLNAVWGYSELKAGLAVTPGAFSAAIGAMVVGKRVGPRGQWAGVFIGSLLFGASCAAMYLLLDSEPQYLAVWLPIGIVAGVGIGAALTGISNAATMALEPQRFASGTGLLMTMRQIGGALGIAVLAAILGRHSIVDDQGYLQVFLACAIGSVAAAAAAPAIRARVRAA